MTAFARILCVAALAATAYGVPYAASAQAPQRSPISVIDVMPAFFLAWDRGAGKPIGERVGLFKELVIYPNRDAYDRSEFKLDDAHVAWYLERVAPYVAEMRGVDTQISGSLPDAERRFLAEFPDLKPVNVYFLPSFMHFAGQTQNGKLFFGVDMLVAYAAHLSIPVVATHELFHIYHAQVNPLTFGESGSTVSPVWSQAWSEGLATYVSQRLNPGATRSTVLAGDELGTLSPAKTREFACAMEPKLASASDADAQPFFDSDAHPPGLPAMGGYLIGLIIAEDAGRTHSLRDLALMNSDEVRTAVQAGVARLCHGT